MTANPTWTPASRPGIIPLHPLGFGTVLGRSFAALRRNPRVLLGFALVVQVISFIVLIVAVGAVAFLSFSRLQNLPAGSPDHDTIAAGSTAIVVLTGFVLGLAAAALGIIVQAVVVTDVAHGAVAERMRLPELWRRVRPVAWRLIGYTALVTVAMLVGFGAVTAIVLSVSALSVPLAVTLTVLAILGAIPLLLWLSTKLLLVPPVILLERATIGSAMARSWRLTRTRFWPILGIVVLIQVIFGAMAQVVTIPFSLFGGIASALIAPTGDPTTGGIVTLVVSLGLTEIVVLLIQSIAIVVQATATSILYIDSRMRHEGLDLDLLSYVERRDAGVSPLADPYTAHIGRVFARPPMAPAYPGYPTPGYPPAAPPAYGPPPGYGTGPAADPQHPAPPAPSSTDWTAPGSGQGTP
ncbi:hypothetical protein GH740_06105 [Microbacterium sp. SYP-A9085]|uniref:glycerophosphoryl diester phosphodiesterase membrane domain-containing protein n=1 Tax=Microbacterium sp. SYP-A9085 TaxID=2664454 RepID=UPI00129A1D32|nr:hypothetical protein [Microbacterium sp. SYP-A9085]